MMYWWGPAEEERIEGDGEYGERVGVATQHARQPGTPPLRISVSFSHQEVDAVRTWCRERARAAGDEMNTARRCDSFRPARDLQMLYRIKPLFLFLFHLSFFPFINYEWVKEIHSRHNPPTIIHSFWSIFVPCIGWCSKELVSYFKKKKKKKRELVLVKFNKMREREKKKA